MGVESPTGSVIGGFRVGELLARGAMGAVYLAEDTDGQRVALKLLSPELAHDERFRQRFLRESRSRRRSTTRTWCGRSPPARTAACCTWRWRYVDGVDLRELLRREGRGSSPSAPSRSCARSGEALDAAHAAGLVHRDVKPGEHPGRGRADGEHAYVCDFGLARHVSSVGSLTGDRGFVGTLDYVAPEQIRGETVDGARRRLRARLRALRVPRGRAAVRARERAGRRVRPPERAAAAAHRAAARAAGRLDTDRRARLAKEPDGRYGTCGALAAAARRRVATGARPRGGRRGGCSPGAVARSRSRARRRRRARASRRTRRPAKPVVQPPLVLERGRRELGSGAREHPLGHAVRLRPCAVRRRPRGPVGVGCCCRASSGCCASMPARTS